MPDIVGNDIDRFCIIEATKRGMPHGYWKFTLAAIALPHDRLSRWPVGHLNAKDPSS